MTTHIDRRQCLAVIGGTAAAAALPSAHAARTPTLTGRVMLSLPKDRDAAFLLSAEKGVEIGLWSGGELTKVIADGTPVRVETDVESVHVWNGLPTDATLHMEMIS